MEQAMRWKLEDLFGNTEEWKAALETAKKDAESLAGMKGCAGANAQNLKKTAVLYEKMNRTLETVFLYAKCKFDENMADTDSKNLYETAVSAGTEISEKLSFLAPELMQLTPEIFEGYCKELPELGLYRKFAQDFFEKKIHVLSSEMEELMVRMSALGSSFRSAFDDLRVNDITFPQIPAPDGGEITANEANYQTALLSSDPQFRLRYYRGLLDTYGKYINTFTSLYYGSVKRTMFEAKSRHYASSRAMSLAENHVPETVYDSLLKAVHENQEPMYEYIAFRKKRLGLDELHFSDLFVPLVKDTGKQYPYEEAKEIVLEALRPLGEDYCAVVRQAMDERWIDVYPAPNKDSGAYSTGDYDHHPLVFLNYTNTLDDVFTLAHELGHAMHTYYSNQNQPYIYAGYTIFCAEVASTLNEQLLAEYLYQKAETKEEKALLLCKQLDDLRSTFYRQTMFADFENETHKMAERGEPLLPSSLCKLHADLNRAYYGPDLVVDDTLSYEWARIPHFYRPFYVYQYATGISAAISISRRILSGTENAVADYRKFLTTGGSDHPIELLRIAGVDMASEQPVLDTVALFRDTLARLKEIL